MSTKLAAPRVDKSGRGSALVLGVVLGLAIAAVLGVLVVAPVALTHRSAGSLETAYGNAVVSLVARVRGTGAGPNPVTVTSRTLEQGREAYTGSCSQCHGAIGDGKGGFGQTTFPPATDLTGPSARAMSDDQLFYVIKNGLGFTAMPAYKSQYTDQEIWALVAFIRAMQQGQAPVLAAATPSAAQLAAGKLRRAVGVRASPRDAGRDRARGGPARRGADAAHRQGAWTVPG